MYIIYSQLKIRQCIYMYIVLRSSVQMLEITYKNPSCSYVHVQCLLVSHCLQECCESGDECILDLLDYCHRSVTKLLVRCEEGEGRGGRMVESEGSDEEDSDSLDENIPSKKKILEVRLFTF